MHEEKKRKIFVDATKKDTEYKEKIISAIEEFHNHLKNGNEEKIICDLEKLIESENYLRSKAIFFTPSKIQSLKSLPNFEKNLENLKIPPPGMIHPDISSAMEKNFEVDEKLTKIISNFTKNTIAYRKKALIALDNSRETNLKLYNQIKTIIKKMNEIIQKDMEKMKKKVIKRKKRQKKKRNSNNEKEEIEKIEKTEKDTLLEIIEKQENVIRSMELKNSLKNQLSDQILTGYKHIIDFFDNYVDDPSCKNPIDRKIFFSYKNECKILRKFVSEMIKNPKIFYEGNEYSPDTIGDLLKKLKLNENIIKKQMELILDYRNFITSYDNISKETNYNLICYILSIPTIEEISLKLLHTLKNLLPINNDNNNLSIT